MRIHVPAHVRQTVEAGGCSTIEDIIKVTVWMKELQRQPVNDEWVIDPHRVRPGRSWRCLLGSGRTHTMSWPIEYVDGT